MMNKKLNIGFHWFFLPFRLLYILCYYLLSKLLNVKNEEFHIYYDKSKHVILTGWLKFYDPDKFWKQIIMASIEILLLLCFLCVHLISTNWITAILMFYSFLYVIIRYDFKSTLKFLRNWNHNQIIKRYVGEELYYYAKWNYEDLTLIFPELAHLKYKGKCVSANNTTRVSLDLCKQIWSNLKQQQQQQK